VFVLIEIYAHCCFLNGLRDVGFREKEEVDDCGLVFRKSSTMHYPYFDHRERTLDLIWGAGESFCLSCRGVALIDHSTFSYLAEHHVAGGLVQRYFSLEHHVNSTNNCQVRPQEFREAPFSFDCFLAGTYPMIEGVALAWSDLNESS
jgi:hypothetical protein